MPHWLPGPSGWWVSFFLDSSTLHYSIYLGISSRWSWHARLCENPSFQHDDGRRVNASLVGYRTRHTLCRSESNTPDVLSRRSCREETRRLSRHSMIKRSSFLNVDSHNYREARPRRAESLLSYFSVRTTLGVCMRHRATGARTNGRRVRHPSVTSS